jgi:hypothetical protein
MLTVAVVAAVATGLLMLDSPAVERTERLDDRRVADLSGIAGAVDLYWTRHGRLPESMDDLNREPGVTIVMTDPATNVPYEYRVVEGDTFEVCGAFDRPTPADQPAGLWSHADGRQCFRRTARRLR